LNAFKGLQIDLVQLQGLEIQEDGQTVLVQGGVYAGPVIKTLWDEGYVTGEFVIPDRGYVLCVFTNMSLNSHRIGLLRWPRRFRPGWRPRAP
jgi:hypothetical protein